MIYNLKKAIIEKEVAIQKNKGIETPVIDVENTLLGLVSELYETMCDMDLDSDGKIDDIYTGCDDYGIKFPFNVTTENINRQIDYKYPPYSKEGIA